jgi:hypothetical protein
MAAEVIQHYAKASASLSREEVRQVQRICEISKQVSKDSIARCIDASEHRPILHSCSADGTPIQVSLEVQQHLPNGRIIRRAGKAAHEFLVGNQFARYLDEYGKAHTSIGVRDPIPLTEGKGHLAIFSACRSMWGTCRQLGHRGGVVEHYSFDRCGYSALRQRMWQFHTLLQDQWGSGTNPSSLLALLEWVVFTPCALHDSQNAFKWSLKDDFDNLDTMKSVFIGVASVRNSMDIIITYIAEWVSETVSFAAPLDDSAKEVNRVIWATLGVADDVIHFLVEVLELCFEGGRLVVKEGIPTMDCINVLVPTLLGVWKIKKFSESRWLSVGRSARSMVASHLTGLGSLLDFARQKPSVSGYYVNGFFRLSDDHWLFLVKAAIVAAVPESAQLSLFKDSRVALTALSIKNDISQALQRIANFPAGVWSKMGEVGHIDPLQLRSDCISSAHTAAGFLDYRFLDHANQLPWSLCRGDISSNLQKLKGGSCPENSEVGEKVWHLLQQGYPESTLKSMVTLLADCPWSTQVAEQLRGSAAVVSRFHPDYSLDTLLSRSMVLFVSKILPSPSKSENEVLKIKQALSKVGKKNPSKAGARHLYFRDLCKVAEAKYEPSRLPAIRKTIMKTHSAAFRSHPFCIRFVYSRQAFQVAAQKREILQKQREALLQDLQAAQEKVDLEARTRQHLSLASAQWGSRELGQFKNLYDSTDFPGSVVHQLRDGSCQAPPMLGLALVNALVGIVVPQEHEVFDCPEWVRKIAMHRQYFSDCVFLVTSAGQTRAYKFLFGVQQPLMVWVSPLVVADYYLDLTSSGPSFEPWPRYDFCMDFSKSLNLLQIADLNLEEILVVPGCVHQGEGRIVSIGVAEPLISFLADLPRSVPKKSSSASQGSSSVAQNLEPWAEAMLQKRAAKTKVGASTSSSQLEAQVSPESDVSEDVLCDPAVMEELEKYRQAWQDAKDVRFYDFQVSVLGGAWTQKHKGVLADAFSGAAKGDQSPDWCRARGMPRSARYEISTYGEENASALARAWCSKMQFLFNHCQKLGDDLHKLSPEELEQWVPPSDLQRVERQLADSRQAQQRLRQLRALC